MMSVSIFFHVPSVDDPKIAQVQILLFAQEDGRDRGVGAFGLDLLSRQLDVSLLLISFAVNKRGRQS
jgi:hypothetical protein